MSITDYQKQFEEWKNNYDLAQERAHQMSYDIDLARFRSEVDNRPNYLRNNRRSDLLYDDNGELLNDPEAEKWLKSKWNEAVSALGGSNSFMFDINDYGQKTNSLNKNYGHMTNNYFDNMSKQELIDYYNNTKEDPNAQNVAYTYRIYDGKDDFTGKDRYLYKTGVTKASVYDRLKGDFSRSGIELLSEKRIAGAEEWENAFQRKFLDEVAVDKGNNQSSGIKFKHGYTEMYGKDILGVDKNQDSYQTRQNMLESINKEKEYYKKHKGSDSWIDALQAGSYNTIGGLGDTLSTGIGFLLNKIGVQNTLENNIFDKLEKNADKIAGYDPQTTIEAGTEALAAWKRGDYFDAIFNDLGAKSNVFIESLPEMMLMSVPFAGEAGSSFKAIKAAKDLINAQKELELLGTTANDLSKAKELGEKISASKSILSRLGANTKDIESLANQSAFATLAKKVARDGGFNSVWAKNTNNVIEQRIANGDKDISFSEFMGIAASQYLLTALDKWSFNEIVKIPKVLKSFKDGYKIAKSTGNAISFLNKLAKTGTEMLIEMGKEGFQEWSQTMGEILGTKVGVNGEDFFDVINDEKNQNEALKAGIMGAASAAHMSLIGSASAETLKAGKNLYDKGKERAKERDLSKAPNVAENVENITGKILSNTEFDNTKKKDNVIEFLHDYIGSKDIVKDPMQRKVGLAAATSSFLLNEDIDTNTKKEFIKDILKSDKFTSDEKAIVIDKIVPEAMKELQNTIITEKGSKTIDSSSSEDILEDQDITDFKDSDNINPVKGKLNHIISSLEASRLALKEANIDTKEIDEALKVVEAYNTSDTFNKVLDSVGQEIENIGYISRDGKVIRPSLKAYKLDLENNILNDTEGFTGLTNFSNFINSRIRKQFNYNEAGHYNLVSRFNKENDEALKLINSILKNNKDKLDPAKQELLINLRNGLINKMVATNNETIKAMNHGREFEGTFKPEEEAAIGIKAIQAKTVEDAKDLLLSINKRFTSPEISTVVTNSISSIFSGRENPYKNSSPTTENVLEESKILDDAQRGIVDPANIGKIKNKNIKEYVEHTYRNLNKPVIQDFDSELNIIQKASTQEGKKKIIDGLLKNFRMSYEQYNTLKKEENIKPQDTYNKIKQAIIEAPTIQDARNVWKTYKKEIDSLPKDKVESLVRYAKSKATNKYNPTNNKEIKVKEPKLKTPEQLTEEYDTRRYEQQIKEFEWLKTRIDLLNKNNKKLSNADKKVLENVQNKLNIEIASTESRLKKAEQMKDTREKYSAIKNIVKTFKKVLSKLNNIIKQLSKKLSILNKYSEVIDNYIKNDIDLRKKQTAKKAIDEAIYVTKDQIRNIEKKAEKETTESLEKKINDDIEQTKIADNSSLRSSIKTKTQVLLTRSVKKVIDIEEEIKKKTKDLLSVSKSIEYLTNYEKKILEKYNNTILAHAKLIDRNYQLEKKIEKQFNHIDESNKRISKTKNKKTIERLNEWIKSHEENIERYYNEIEKNNNKINKLEDKLNALEEKLTEKSLKEKANKLNKLINIQSKLLETKRKLNDKFIKEKYGRAFKYAKLFNDSESSEKLDKLSIEPREIKNKSVKEDITNETKPMKIKKEESFGYNIVNNIKNEKLKEYIETRVTPLSALKDLFTNPTKELVDRLIKRYGLKDDTFKSIEFISKLIKKIKDPNIIHDGNIKLNDNGEIVKNDTTKYYRALSLFGKSNKDIKELIKFGTVMMRLGVEAVKFNILQMDDDDIAKTASIPLDTVGEYRQMIMSGYIPQPVLISELSTIILNRAGIKFKKNTPLKTVELIEKSIMAATTSHFKKEFVKKGNEVKKTFGNKQITMLKVGKLNLEEYQKHYARINYMNPDSVRKKPMDKPYKVKEDETIVNSFIKLSDKQKKNIEKFNNIEYYFSNNLKELKSLYTKDRKELLKAFGYVELNDNMPVQEAMLQKAHNEKIERETDIMFDHYNEFSFLGFYVPHAITKSGRYNVRSDLNIQESKIHRAFVHSKDYISTLNTLIKRNILDIPYGKINATEMFEVALHQSFDMDPDKKSHYAVFKEIRDKIDIYDKDGVKIKYKEDEKGWKALDTFINAPTIDTEALSTIFHEFGGMHAVQASMELRRLNRAEDKSNFKTTLFVEADAITSGSILLSLKTLSEDSIKLIEKGGIYTKEAKQKYEKYVKHLLSKKYGIDEKHFNLTAGALIEAGQYHLELIDGRTEYNEKEELIPERIEIDGKKYEAFIDIYTTIGLKALQLYTEFKTPNKETGKSEYDNLSDTHKKLFDKIFGENPNLKDLRKLAKDPTMVFNYGALISSIKKALNRNTYVKEIYDEIIEAKSLKPLTRVLADAYYANELRMIKNPEKKKSIVENAKKKAKKYAKEYINNRFNYRVYDKELNVFREPTQDEFTNIINNNTMYKHIILDESIKNLTYKAYGEKTIGKFFEKALTDTFKDISDMRNATKNIDILIANMFNIKLKSKLESIEGPITKENLIKTILELHKEGFGHSMDIGSEKQPLYKIDKTKSDETRAYEETFNIKEEKFYVSVTTESISFIDNSGAAVTIPIHATDGRIIIEALKNNDFTNIYDAILAGLNHNKIIEATTNYNRAAILESFKSQDFKSYFEKMNKMFESLTDKELDELHKAISPLKENDVLNVDQENTVEITNYKTVNAFYSREIGKFTNQVFENKNTNIPMRYSIVDNGKKIFVTYNDGNTVIRNAEISIEGNTAKVIYKTLINVPNKYNRNLFGETSRVKISKDLNTTIQIDPRAQLTPEYIDKIVSDAIAINLQEMNGNIPTLKPNSKAKNSAPTERKYIDKATSIKPNIPKSKENTTKYYLEKQNIFNIIESAPLKMIDKIKDEAFKLNNFVKWFNGNIDELYSSHMFVNGVELTKVELTDKTKPKLIDTSISDNAHKFNKLLMNDIILYVNDYFNDKELANKFLEYIDFENNTINSDADIVSEKMFEELVDEFGLKMLTNNTSKIDSLLNEYINNKEKGC